MTKTDMKKIAKEKLMESIATAYYRLENDNYSDSVKEEIAKYIDRYGARMAKAISKTYYTM